ncbi:MAG: MobA/MobL family protein [Lachnospiraceae bacterium]|nr:MobA/MobL family protein [Lachnospiraceae bacterium]
MALYHYSLNHVKRREGHTAIAAAAYRSGEKLYDKYYGEVQDYTKKGGVIMSEILLPDYVPERLKDRETLWYEVENHENRKDAQLAYSFDFALQNELSMEENIEIARRYIMENFVAKGMICDIAIHDPDKGEGGIPNPHVHVLVPIRPVNQDGEWGEKRLHIPVFDENGNPVLNEKGKQKYEDPFTTDWGKPETLEIWRENWANIVNEKFAEKGLDCRIDHRSNEARGLDEIPQVHEGSAVRRMEKRGIKTYKGSWNRWVKRTNDNIRKLLNALKELAAWIGEAKERVHRIENPTISNMVMTYFDHRNEVAEGYACGTQKAKKGNLQYVSKVQVYIEQNNLTTIDELEKVIAEKDDLLKQAKDELDRKKAEVKRIKRNLSLIDDYHNNKAVYEESRKIFFKAKQAEYREKHHAEISKFQKAKRILSEQGYDEPSFQVCREMWNEKLASLEEEIKTKSEEIKTSPISEEVKVLEYIKDAVDFVTDKKKSDGDGDNDGGDAASGGEQMTISDDTEKKAKEQARQDQERQAAQLQAQQQTQTHQNGRRERVSLKAKLDKGYEAVKKYDENRQAAIARGEIVPKKRDDQNLS